MAEVSDIRPLFPAASAEPTPLAVALGGSPDAAAVTPHLAVDPERSAERKRVAQLEAERERAVRRADEATAARTDEAARYADAIAAITEAVDGLPERLADDIVDLAMVAARAIVDHELTADRDRVAASIAQLINDADDLVEIRIGAADLQRLRERHPDAIPTAARIVEDDALDPGGFVIECADAIIDGTIDARLARVRAAVALAFTAPEKAGGG